MSIITFVRHGNATRKEEGQKDGERLLTPLGINQVYQLRAQLNRPSYGLVISSTSRRADDTATIVVGRTPDITLDELAPLSEGCSLDRKVHEMFLKHGYASARTWLANDHDGALHWKASVGLARVFEEISKADYPEHVLVSSHSVFLLSMAAMLCIGLPHAETFLDMDIQEAGAIVIGHNRELLGIYNDPIPNVLTTAL